MFTPRRLPGIAPAMIMASTSSLSTSAARHDTDQAAVLHHRQAVGEIEDVVDVVADQDDADPLARQFADQRADLAGLLRSERRRRLVHDQDPGVEVDGAGDGHRLALAAGKRRDKVGAATAAAASSGSASSRAASSIASSFMKPSRPVISRPRKRLATESRFSESASVW